LTEAELVHYQNKFGKVSFIAKELKKTEKKWIYYLIFV
jgi:hypothetical protein